VELTVTDPNTGLSATISQRINPATVALTFRTNPGGLHITLAPQQTLTTPYTITVIVKHQFGVTAPSPETVKRQTHYWQSWSDGGALTHVITTPPTATTYTVYYRKR
jgi:hypothetical protein